MDPGRLVKAERKVPFMNGRQPEKCVHGNEKGLGCCGYDELAVKPATTTPITFGSRPQARKVPKEEAQMGERPRIQAMPMPSADIQVMPGNQPMPVQPAMGGRIPDGNFGVGAQVRSIFDVPRQAPRAESSAPQRPRILARSLGQEAPPAPPPAEPAPVPPPAPPPVPPDKVEAVLRRETPPEGLTKQEAADLAAALTPALENSALALAEGEQCLGVDDSSLKKASGLRDGLVRFATQAPENARLEVDPADITLMEQVLECSELYLVKKQAASAKTVAFVLGGLLVGTVVLVLAS
jgi:hypothetical protein